MVSENGPLQGLKVQVNGKGQVSHTGSALLLSATAEALGLPRLLSDGMASTRKRRSAHNPGQVLCQLAVVLADGGTSLSDLATLREQPELFGDLPSDSTAFRVIDSVDEEVLAKLNRKMVTARANAYKLGANPSRERCAEGQRELTIIDADATLLDAHSNKEHARGTWKKGFGFHPILAYRDDNGEALAGILRPGNAGSNTASDHIKLINLSLAQLDDRAMCGQILFRCDGAGATHETVSYCRGEDMLFSVGFDLTDNVRQAVTSKDGWETGWVQALHTDGSERKYSQIKEFTGIIPLTPEWGETTRILVRRSKIAVGVQQTLADHDGYKLSVFITDQAEPDLRILDLTQRGHAHVEERIREGKDCGLRNLPFKSFRRNQVWLWLVQLAQNLLAWARQLALGEEAGAWELKTLRYRLLYQSARIAHHARQRVLRLSLSWPWAALLAVAFARLKALPDPSIS